MSPSERELAFAAETVTGGSRSPVLVAVKGGDLATVRTVLKWLPEGQVGPMSRCFVYEIGTRNWE